MKRKSLLIVAFLISYGVPVAVLAETPKHVSVVVVDDQGKPVEGAEVQARYLQTVPQDGKVYHVPTKLAQTQTTDANGRCELNLQDVSWSLAGLYAHRVELTTDQVSELYDDAPRDAEASGAFEREINDRAQRYSSAYQILLPNHDADLPITLKLAKAVKVTGRVHIGGRPLKSVFVTISSPKTDIDRLFPRSSPWLTDEAGKFSFYTVPGKLDRAKIVVEREQGNRILDLADVPSTPTPTGLVFDFDTKVADYKLAAE